MSEPVTWSSATTTPLVVSVASDPIETEGAGSVLSVSLTVTGSAPSGVTGDFQIQGSNSLSGPWVNIPGAFQSVLVGSGGSSDVGIVADPVGYDFARLAWTAGQNLEGAASGAWSTTVGAVPVVTDFSPAPGTTIYSDTQLAFTVESPVDLPFVCLLLVFSFPNGQTEVAYRDGLVQPFYAGSEVQAVTGGFQFTMLRVGGWPSQPTLEVTAVDTSGEINV